MSPLPDDLTEGWPDDLQNEELVRFAGELAAARPELPAEAMARLEQRLHRELTARRRRGFVLAAVAAAVLLGVGAFFLLKPPGQPARPTPVVEIPEPAGPIHDQYVIDFAAPPAVVKVDRALVRLEQHQSLFTD